jgi:hypothetical protein
MDKYLKSTPKMARECSCHVSKEEFFSFFIAVSILSMKRKSKANDEYLKINCVE